MANQNRIVRKISPDKLADFDEQWWPITLLLLVSAGSLAGYVYTNPLSDWTTDVWYRNARVQLYTIAGTAAALLVGLALLRGSSQRRLQLGVFLSLAFHIGLIFFSRQMYMEYVAATADGEPPGLPAEKEVILPDYVGETQDVEAAIKELTKPAETKLREESKVELTPKTPEQMKAEKKTAEEPEPTPTKPVAPLEVARNDPKTPEKSQVLTEETRARREMEKVVRAENAPQQPTPAAATTQRSLSSQQLDISRQETATEQARRLDAAAARAMDVVRPTTSPAAPQRRTVADQLASSDAAAAQARRITTANTEATTIEQQAPAAMTPAQQIPLEAPQASVQTPTRSSAPLSSGNVAMIESPSIALSPGSAAQPSLARAEAPESSDAVAMAMPTGRPQRLNASGPATGFEPTAAAMATAPTSVAPGAAGGSSPAAPLATTTRGDRGTPQSSVAGTQMSLPSPVGQGDGAAIGSPSVGPMRRSDAVGDGTAGEASSAGVMGRPGRGRTAGTGSIADNQIAGGELVAMIGPTSRAGNATTGTSSSPTTVSSGTGASLGERTVLQSGAGLRAPGLGGPGGTGTSPGGGMLAGAGGAPAGIVGGTGAGAASGVGGAPGIGTGAGSDTLGPGGIAGGSAAGSAATTRRDLGELAGAGSGREAENMLGGRRARSDLADGRRDRHGNLMGSANDLIADGQMIGEKIVLVTFYVDEEVEGSPLIGALAAKGYVVERLTADLPAVEDFARQLDGARQIWLISSEVNRLPADHQRVLIERWRAGKLAICLMVDNTPFTAEATAVLSAIAPGTTITGDYLGEQKLKASPDGRQPGFDPRYPIFHNVETLFEGTTISHINSRYLQTVAVASNGLPLIGVYQQPGSSRLLVHCGFTSLYERFWDDAGVSRFAVNVAGWLSEADKKPIRIITTPPAR
jgi:hypothetical protein